MSTICFMKSRNVHAEATLRRRSKTTHPKYRIPASTLTTTVTGTLTYSPDARIVFDYPLFSEAKTHKVTRPIDTELLDACFFSDQVTAQVVVDDHGVEVKQIRCLKRGLTHMVGVVDNNKLRTSIGNVTQYWDILNMDEVKPNTWVKAAIGNEYATNVTVLETLNSATPTSVREMVFAHYNLQLQPPLNLDLPEVKHNAHTRLDHRSLPTITIDASSTRDVDDALSAAYLPDGSIKVFVHISDVSSFVKPGSSVYEYAKNTGSSTYLPGFSAPMLPSELSEMNLSLLPNQDRPTLTVSFIVSPAGKIANVAVYRALINSCERTTPLIATNAINGEETDISTSGVSLLKRLNVAHKRIRSTNPHMNILADVFRPNAHANLKVTRPRHLNFADPYESAKFTSSESNPPPEASTLVETFMVSANTLVGAWMKERELPASWRNHNGFDGMLADNLRALFPKLRLTSPPLNTSDTLAAHALNAAYVSANEQTSTILRSVCLKQSARAQYEATPRGHFSLASKTYLHFTSPLRRFADLYNHLSITAYLDNNLELLQYLRDENETVCKNLNLANAKTSAAEVVFKKAGWAILYSSKKGQMISGRITGFKAGCAVIETEEDGVQVTSTNLELEVATDGLSATSNLVDRNLYLGQLVYARIHKTNPLAGTITVKLPSMR